MIHLPYKVGISQMLLIRGMIATEDIRKGAVIERCPVIPIPITEKTNLLQTELQNYYFEWTNSHNAIVLGYGSLINHSFKPNAAYTCGYKNKVMIYYAIRLIKKGEEVFINYNGTPNDTTPLAPGLTSLKKF